MQAASSSTPALDQLPDPSTIWWRSRYLARQRQVDRATRPIRLVERLGLIVGTAGSAIAATLVWPQLKSSVAGWLSSLAAETQGAAQVSPTLQALLFATAILAMVAAGLYAQWAQD